MKKVLVSLLVLALAMTSVFAGIDFSGKFVAGYTFNTTDWKNWTSQAYGEDKEMTNPLKLDASIADENGLWSITMKGALVADDRLAGTATVDLGKIIMGADSDVSIALALVANNRVAGLNAYNNASGFNMTRIRTVDKGLWTSLTVGYGDYVKVQVAGGPSNMNTPWAPVKDADTHISTSKPGADFTASALVQPVNGIGVSVGYVLTGETKWEIEDTNNDTAKNGQFNAAVNVDIAALADLDFDLGLSVGDRWAIGAGANLVAATVYGGVDVVGFSAEYALATQNDAIENYFNVGLDLNVVEGLKLNVYTGAMGLGEAHAFKDAFFVGGNVGYTYSNIGINLNVQYAGANAKGYMGDVSEGAVKYAGFAITPSMSIAW